MSDADQVRILTVVESLHQAHHAWSLFRVRIHRETGNALTPPQADVLFSLRGTEGLTCADIGNRTCITKGTLTGIVDRLQSRGLVERWEDEYDGRRTIVALTNEGEALSANEYSLFLEQLTGQLHDLEYDTADEATQALQNISTLLA
jgi:DNA-binding MarR family transcriptional regulator